MTSFSYRPDHDWSTLAGDEPGGDWVSDSFTYQANDGTTDSNIATFRFWLAPINDPPTFSAGADVTRSIDDGAYDAVWATAISAGPANEAAQTVGFLVEAADTSLFSVEPAIDGNGHLSFTPKPDAVGLTDVTVQAIDDGGLEDYGLSHSLMDPPDDTSDVVTFHVAITASVLPHPADDTATVAEDDPDTEIDVLANDTDGSDDPISVVDVTDPAHGTATVAVDGSDVTYRPDADYHGSDTFDYTIEAGGDQATASVDVTVTPVEDDPQADDDGATVAEDAGPTGIDVLAGDTDPDGDTITITDATNGAKGTVAIDPDGLGLTYDPTTNADGSDTFTYTSTTATAARTRRRSRSRSPRPTTLRPPMTTAPWSPRMTDATAVDVLTGDTDLDGDAITITAVTNGSKGTVADHRRWHRPDVRPGHERQRRRLVHLHHR